MKAARVGACGLIVSFAMACGRGGERPVGVTPAERAPATSSRVALADPKSSNAEVARARQLVEQGMKLYAQGEYDKAEEVLKRGIEIYPFMADANLALAKILLIRASATKDMTLYTNARLMLEMARALDPNLREVEQLLELVRRPTTE